MSKYNRIVSIPIETLSKEEIKVAIKEWAEGDEGMEELLWACYNNGVETNGCHAGSYPYIGFRYNKERTDVYIRTMNTTLVGKGSQILAIPDGGNPFSGPGWYEPTLSLGSNTKYKDIADKQFKKIVDAINNKPTPCIIDTTPIIDLLNFFIGKLTNYLFRVRHHDDNSYTFYVECSTDPTSEIYKFTSDQLLPLGFSIVAFEEGPMKNWTYTTNEEQKFNEVIKKASIALINNYSLDIPNDANNVRSLTIKAQILRKQLTEKEFMEWLEKEKKERDTPRLKKD